MSSKDSPHSWLRMHGTRRIAAEFKHLSALIDQGKLPQLSNLHLPNDDMLRWRVHVSDFDEEIPAGAAVNRDLQELKRSKGQDFMLMELQFPGGDSYPTAPFFLRVITPRCQMYTGHVTAGGSICIQVRRWVSLRTCINDEQHMCSVTHSVYLEHLLLFMFVSSTPMQPQTGHRLVLDVPLTHTAA